MATSQNNLTGRMKGKVGNARFSTVFGQNVVASQPFEPRVANDSVHVNQRSLFASAIPIAKQGRLIAAIAKRSARTGRNKAMSPYSYIIKDILAAITGTGDAKVIDLGAITMGVGDLLPTPSLAPVIDISSKTLQLSWDPNVLGNQKSSDVPTCVVYNFTKGLVYVMSNGDTRADETSTFVFPDGFFTSGDVCATFLCFDSADGLLFDAPTSQEPTEQA